MAEEPSEAVTQILKAVGRGDSHAARDLLPLIYSELRKLAKSRMAHLPPGNTLQPTALVHEAYLRLVGKNPMGWNSRGHFFGAASRAMWQILVEQARSKGSLKRGGDRQRIDIDQIDLRLGGLSSGQPSDDVIALDEAFDLLGRDSRKTQIVLLRYLAGLTAEETAAALDISISTVEREWRFARAFLYRHLSST